MPSVRLGYAPEIFRFGGSARVAPEGEEEDDGEGKAPEPMLAARMDELERSVSKRSLMLTTRQSSHVRILITIDSAKVDRTLVKIQKALAINP
jgi:hypothetical protein